METPKIKIKTPKARSSKKQKAVPATLSVINSDNTFDKECTTRTLIATMVDKKCAKEKNVNLNECLLEGYQTKFRNCIIKKFDNICVKLYSNMTVQVTGCKSEKDFFECIKNINYPESIVGMSYVMDCVMMNYTVTVSTTELNLNRVMDKINESEKGIAYFLRSYPLIIKYKYSGTKTVFDYKAGSQDYQTRTEQYTKDVSVLLFKSGNCIIVAVTQDGAVSCARFVMDIVNNINADN